MWQGRVVEVAANDCVSPACGAEMLGSEKHRLWHGKGLGRTVLSPFGEHLGRSLSAAGACSKGPGAWQSWTHQRGGQESCRLKVQGASVPGTGVPCVIRVALGPSTSPSLPVSWGASWHQLAPAGAGALQLPGTHAVAALPRGQGCRNAVHPCQALSLVSAGPSPWESTGTSSPAVDSI